MPNTTNHYFNILIIPKGHYLCPESEFAEDLPKQPYYNKARFCDCNLNKYGVCSLGCYQYDKNVYQQVINEFVSSLLVNQS